MPDSVSPSLKGGVFALGNFDGVHRGHQAVVRTALEKARGMGVPARVMTFEPHPRAVFRPHDPPFRLTPAPAKVRLLQALDVEDVIVLPFTAEFSTLPAAEFVQRVLIETYAVQHVVAGFDFVFGYQRGGNMHQLREHLKEHGVGVTEVIPFRDAQGEVMSSSRARDALRRGDVETAEHILGRPWALSGTVLRGVRRGSALGIPTANITLGDYLRPQFGVYAVNARRVGGAGGLQGVANIGVRPTVDGKNEFLEVHLFAFDGDIYGQEWEVELIDFLRPEQTFPDIEALRTQILRDIDIAKRRLGP
jgi:riboflavin kinase/FMN adenylyltransferase